MTPSRRLVIGKGTHNSVAYRGNVGTAVLRLLLAGTTVALSQLLFSIDDEPARAAWVVTIYACAGLFAALVFRPRGETPVFSLFGWCATVTALVVAISVADPDARPALAFLPRVSVTFMLLAATVAIATKRLPVPVAVAIVGLLSLMPVWAAPAVELAGNPARFTDTVVAASPLTVFSVSLDLDYLRTSWFYINSSLGSMRYSYPSWISLCLFLSALPAAAIVRERLRSPAISPIRPLKEAYP